MQKKFVSLAIGELEYNQSNLLMAKEAKLQLNPSDNVSRFDSKIAMCQKSIQQFNKQLLVSTAVIDEDVLNFVENLIEARKEGIMISK